MAPRSPLRADDLRARLCAPNGPYAAVDVVAETGSTNADLAGRATGPGGAADRTVLAAEHQSAGRGRLGRHWESPPGAGLTFSVLLRPDGVPAERLGWMPLLAGLALQRTIVGQAPPGLPVQLKWPNDLLIGADRGKVAGMLAEVVPGPAVVVGIGINVDTGAEELPPGAVSLRLAGLDPPDRTDLLADLLIRLSEVAASWQAAGGDPQVSGLLAGYRAACGTIGSAVRVDLPDGGTLFGTAVDVDGHGRLVIWEPAGTTRAVAAGDVVHLRTGRGVR
jgi:BirA family biotin operon repressor/biotin-[acetyl-CoA-carboxylase] ligase